MLAIVAAFALFLTPARAAGPGDYPAPARGGFDWSQLEGSYDFGACRASGKPIWSDDPANTFVAVMGKTDYNPSPASRSLDLFRPSRGNSPLAPGFSIDQIDEGPQRRRDPETNEVIGELDSYATADGVYGALSWKNPHNVGWMTVQLIKDARGVRYVMRKQQVDDNEPVREETCELKLRVDPRFLPPGQQSL